MDKVATALGRGGVAMGVLGLGLQDDKPYSFLFTVDGGQRAVMFNRLSGVSDKIYTQGTHFKLPWLMVPQMYDVTMQPKLIQTSTGTKDLQTVSIHLRVLFKPDIENLPNLHKRLGKDYDERVLPSVGNEVLKSVVAKYDAEQLLTLRSQVSNEIRHSITERAKQFDLQLHDISITHLAYGKEFARAIEDKQVAQEEAKRQKYVVARTEQEQKVVITKAEGEAQAATVISEALKQHGKGYIEVKRIETAREIAETMAKAPNVMYLPSSQNCLMQLGGAGGR